MERIEHRFKQGPVFVAYLTAGDGGIQRTLDAALALIEGGVTLLEIGVPFSDPIADGPVIQRAAMRALAAGTTLKDVLWLVSEIRKRSAVPLILFSYLNPILSVLHTSFFDDAREAGLDGALLVDCPIEESGIFHQACLKQHMAPIYVITPSTPLERIQRIDRDGHGFLYYACQKGTTGVRSTLPADFNENIKRIKSAVHLPVVCGFGISTTNAVRDVLHVADGVVVGSLFVKAMEEDITTHALTQLTRHLFFKEAL
ncbi:MAG TPA: tryptophan synthase subunit alpha [Legionella sp.]|nr:tryptophan synthase subunit alpha [Legionella sp.]